MVPCLMSPVGYSQPLLGALRIVSATDPKPLTSTVVRDDEGQLVSAAKAGDISAFEELVNRYERKIFRLGMNITQNREDAEDVMQDAFLKSYQNLDRFQGDSRFYTWLVRIAVNEALMKLRKRRPNQVSLDEPLTQAEDPVFREIEDWGPSPEQRFAFRVVGCFPHSPTKVLYGAIVNSDPTTARLFQKFLDDNFKTLFG